MTRPTQHPALAAAARAGGWRRVDLVRIRFTADGTRAEVVGVCHRYPRTVAVPLALAGRLIGAGARWCTESAPAPAPAPAAGAAAGAR